MYEQKELTGSLFQNDKKGNDKAPNMKGKCLLNGETYFISAWTNITKEGSKYLSLLFKKAEKK